MIYDMLDDEIKLPFEVGFRGLMGNYFLPLKECFNFPYLILAEVDKKKKCNGFCITFYCKMTEKSHSVGF